MMSPQSSQLRSLSLRRAPSEDKERMAAGDSLDTGLDKEVDKGVDTAGGDPAGSSSTLAKLATYYRDTASIHGVTQVGGKQIYGFRR